MWKRVLIGLLLLLAVGGGAIWLNRDALLFLVLTNVGKNYNIAPNQEIAWAAGPDASDRPLSERPPNIIFILADDLGINDISTYGGGVAGGRVPTPNIDRLAAMGANFTTAYSGTSSCAPSRAMIMTGRYPTRTGFEFTPTPDGMGRVVSTIANKSSDGRPRVEWNAESAGAMPPYREQGLPGSEVTIAEVLKAAGYHTVHIGKWHTGHGPEFGPNAQGFDEALIMASALHLEEDDPGVVNAKLDFDPIDRFLWARMQYAASFNEGPWFEPGGYLADYWTDEAIKVMKANRHRPFFLKLSHWAVHTPLQATKEDYEAVGDIEPHRLRVYAAMVRSLDRSVGRLLDALEAEGLAENTLIVFTSDNGGAGYIGLDEVNAPYRGWKLTLFEGGIRVPMFIAWPGRIAPATKLDAPVAHIDLMPTFASAAGAALPEGVAIDGVDLLPFASGTAAAETRPHEAIFWQSAYYKVVRKGDWKLQWHEKQGKAWLFNLAEDPTEEVNLAQANPDKLAELKAALDKHQEGARAPLYPYTIESPVLIDKTILGPYVEGDEYAIWPN